jgi:hypothetical protein
LDWECFGPFLVAGSIGAGSSSSQTVDPDIMPCAMQQSGHGPAIAAVVASSSENHQSTPCRNVFPNRSTRLSCGVFHQLDAGDSEFLDRTAVEVSCALTIKQVLSVRLVHAAHGRVLFSSSPALLQ